MLADLLALHCPRSAVERSRITKSRKECEQIVANRDSELGYAFAIAGYALLFDALLSFVSPAHCGRIPYRPRRIGLCSDNLDGCGQGNGTAGR